MGIGSKLSALLEASGTNVNELAKKVGVSPQTIYSIIKRDSKKADIGVLLRIADTLGVTVEYFVDDYQNQRCACIEGDYTPAELEEIKSFAEYVRGKRSNHEVTPPLTQNKRFVKEVALPWFLNFFDGYLTVRQGRTYKKNPTRRVGSVANARLNVAKRSRT